WRIHSKKISGCHPLNISTASAFVKPKFYWKQPTTPLRKLPKSMAFLHNLSSHKHSNAKPTQPPPNIVEQGAGLRVPDVERKTERRRTRPPSRYSRYTSRLSDTAQFTGTVSLSTRPTF